MRQEEIRVLKVAPGEVPVPFTLKNTLEGMQEAVGGWIELIPIDLERGIDILCNEEGKLIGLPGNRRIGHDIIVGTFYVLKTDDEGECCSLSAEELGEYFDRFYLPEYFTEEDVQQTIRCGFVPFGEDVD